jgi:hypothetical protein
MMFSPHTQKKQYFPVGIFILNFLLLTTYYLLPTSVSAATLSIDPDTLTVGPGDTFVATIRLETLPDECVNAASVELLYPVDWMNASAVSKGPKKHFQKSGFQIGLWPIAISIHL